MSNDLSSLEQELRQLRPAALDEALLERLGQCAAGAWTRTRPVEMEFEHRLRGIAPAAVHGALMERLHETVSAVPFSPEPSKILPFPACEAAAPRRRSRAWWSAAAAVALLGAIAGLMIPNGSQPAAPVVAEKSVPTPRDRALPSRPGVPLVPASFNRGLSEAIDEGVLMYQNRVPHRVLKFVYLERVTLKDADGRTYQVEQPRVEYILVPAKTD